MAGDDSKANLLTEGETKLFVSIMSHLQSDIAFDADAVAAELGYRSGKVVKDRWGQVKKKRGIATAAAAAGGSPGGVTKATPTRKSAATPKKLKLENSGDDTVESPLKGKGGRKVKAVAVKVEKAKEEDVEEDAEEDDADGDVGEDDVGDEEVSAGKPVGDKNVE